MVSKEVMEKYDREMDRKARVNMECFAEFIARMIEKYGEKVLAEIEKEESENMCCKMEEMVVRSDHPKGMNRD